ncbi:MAG TPA: M1 family metallopeptidase, partial [Anaerolineae bacterium]|nr:M1 family metallopeptidase [Anaerolineae bacterium]
TLDPQTKTLTAHQTISYLNNTNTSIPDLIFHLYLNAFSSPDSIFLSESGTDHRGFSWNPDYPGTIDITSLALADGTPLDIIPLADGTLAQAQLPTPISPNETIHLDLTFTATLPEVFARTGFADDDFFMVGQWFPKLGRWQDNEWNAYPFHANNEFFADFGTYNVTITLPDNYITGATGLQTDHQTNNDGTQTITYHATDVIDFAWTASPYFLEANRQVADTTLRYLYLPEHDWSVDRLLDAAEQSLLHFNGWYGPYPYAQLTLVDVPDSGGGAGGMEYPTLVTVGTEDILGLNYPTNPANRGLEIITIHEIAHQWWQSMVAFNEAEEPWLDEGFTDYSTGRLVRLLYNGNILDSPQVSTDYLNLLRATFFQYPDISVTQPAADYTLNEYPVSAYAKPNLALTTLEKTLGDDTMLAIMSTFFDRYQYAHPTTADFRAVAEEVAAQDLSWFFDSALETDTLNYAVTDLTPHQFTVDRDGDLIIPTTIQLTFADGTITAIDWDGQEAPFTQTYPDQTLTAVIIDPEQKILLDLMWQDNGRFLTPTPSHTASASTRTLYTIQDWLLILGGL